MGVGGPCDAETCAAAQADRGSGPAAEAAAFFALVAALSVPFWLLGALAERPFLSGLPVSALMAVCPAAAASILAIRAGAGALSALWRAAFAPSGAKPARWLVLAAIFKPLVAAASYWLLVWSGRPPPVFSVDALVAVGLLAVFLLASVGEEIGWTAYAAPRLIRSVGLRGCGLTIGAFDALWHVVPLLQAGRSWDWIAWWSLGAIAQRLIIVWLYARGGVPAAILFHTMSNMAWLLFPVMGSHYDPASTSLLITAAALALAAIPAGRR